MAWVLSDVLLPNFDGPLIENQYVKAGLFVVKTTVQRNTVLKTLYRQLDGSTTTLCYVSAEGAIYELIANPSTEGTTNQDWKRLDFGVSDILIARGTWDADNTTPVLADTDAVGNGNDFYVVTGAATPTQVQIPGLFQGQEVTVTNGDWIISNGTYWFVSPAPINWDSISGRPTVIDEYVAGTVIAHPHEIVDVNGLQEALDLKYDLSNVADNTIAYALVPDEKIISKLVLDTNFYNKLQTYTQTEVNNLLSAISVPLTTKGDLLGHTGAALGRLPIGPNGYILVPDNTAPLGFKWIVNPNGDGIVSFGQVEIRTLVSGVASIGSFRNYLIAAETGTIDDMIELTGLSIGNKVLLRADAGDTITIKHNDAGATIKILLQNNEDFVLDEIHPLEFILTTATTLVQVFEKTGRNKQSLTITDANYTDAFVIQPNINILEFTLPASGLTNDWTPASITGFLKRNYEVRFIKLVEQNINLLATTNVAFPESTTGDPADGINPFAANFLNVIVGRSVDIEAIGTDEGTLLFNQLVY